ncbi:unnamed protein product [Didymodactylos carnosus]|uniref:Uncharacterized protein n=1 Tax=Didymodactylos carnosus TaxID=1234261 RepID=A0A813YHE0_9BILA|nr:unnamed protein product [Didymodactylos carnosus]CAF0884236.1 unnamed protein product [Didymodactylos carnosus]CAF3557523.1 unnamed protein product [Didymodactylos carnosus]CAF3669790.1 unnamed protein product [Didymodactylos carnosus]
MISSRNINETDEFDCTILIASNKYNKSYDRKTKLITLNVEQNLNTGWFFVNSTTSTTLPQLFEKLTEEEIHKDNEHDQYGKQQLLRKKFVNVIHNQEIIDDLNSQDDNFSLILPSPSKTKSSHMSFIMDTIQSVELENESKIESLEDDTSTSANNLRGLNVGQKLQKTSGKQILIKDKIENKRVSMLSTCTRQNKPKRQTNLRTLKLDEKSNQASGVPVRIEEYVHNKNKKVDKKQVSELIEPSNTKSNQDILFINDKSVRENVPFLLATSESDVDDQLKTFHEPSKHHQSPLTRTNHVSIHRYNKSQMKMIKTQNTSTLFKLEPHRQQSLFAWIHHPDPPTLILCPKCASHKDFGQTSDGQFSNTRVESNAAVVLEPRLKDCWIKRGDDEKIVFSGSTQQSFNTRSESKWVINQQQKPPSKRVPEYEDMEPSQQTISNYSKQNSAFPSSGSIPSTRYEKLDHLLSVKLKTDLMAKETFSLRLSNHSLLMPYKYTHTHREYDPKRNQSCVSYFYLKPEREKFLYTNQTLSILPTSATVQQEEITNELSATTVDHQYQFILNSKQLSIEDRLAKLNNIPQNIQASFKNKESKIVQAEERPSSPSVPNCIDRITSLVDNSQPKSSLTLKR